MDRLVRDRGSMGRRVWRRKRRRSRPGDGGDEATAADASPSKGPFDEPFPPEPFPPEAFREETDELQLPPPRRGLLSAIKNVFSRKDTPPPPEPAYLAVDPTREVLAVPRGAARLEAFEAVLRMTPTESPSFRRLALAFHKELLTMAAAAGVDLSLFEGRVHACAKALVAAGEDERAGSLYLRLGRRHQAAELFVSAGAIEALEETHAHIHFEEGGVKHEARLSFERFEALFVVGRRAEALLALEKAHSLWHDHPIYNEIRASFLARLSPPRRLSLTAGDSELFVVGDWPLVIGRGDDAAVRVASPLVSRAHLRVERGQNGPVVVDLESRGGTRVGGEPLVGRQPLPPGADIDMAGVVVHTRAARGALWLRPALGSNRRTLASMATIIHIPPPKALDSDDEGIVVHFDARGRAFVDPPAVVNGEAITQKLLLLAGDRIGADGWHWTVARR